MGARTTCRGHYAPRAAPLPAAAHRQPLCPSRPPARPPPHPRARAHPKPPATRTGTAAAVTSRYLCVQTPAKRTVHDHHGKTALRSGELLRGRRAENYGAKEFRAEPLDISRGDRVLAREPFVAAVSIVFGVPSHCVRATLFYRFQKATCL